MRGVRPKALTGLAPEVDVEVLLWRVAAQSSDGAAAQAVAARGESVPRVYSMVRESGKTTHG